MADPTAESPVPVDVPQTSVVKVRWNVIAEHEIRNISCAAQDPEDLCTFAYITKDLQTSHHYCHVFGTADVNQAYEIILTLGQAFEVAYQLAIQAQKSRHPDPISRPSKPIPKPRGSIRRPHCTDSQQQQSDELTSSHQLAHILFGGCTAVCILRMQIAVTVSIAADWQQWTWCGPWTVFVLGPDWKSQRAALCPALY
ncbi:unnamed protein product [Ranitomeya imitator]|uniref:PID domain-containing protein n=1 Tax=Ranitomeya imitator TaxID=111125 RepID=A0ABN9LPQ1_9NEOB|nr:unnamed protein product [Ranitomeya imitator]